MLKRTSTKAQVPSPALSGAALQADFVSAITNMTTAAVARLTAERSEQDALDTINYAGAQHQHAVTNPEDIAPELQQSIVRSSLDAHLQKAQAQQIDSLTNQELDRLDQEVIQNYKGKKVRATMTDKGFKPFESYWFNSKTGQERQGVITSKTITGTIDEIALRKNLIVLKPTFLSRLFVPERKFYVVFVVNPDSLQPAVELTLV